MYFGRTGADFCVKLWKMFSWPPQQWVYSLKRYCSLRCWPKMLWPRGYSTKIAEKRKTPSTSEHRELNLKSRQQPTQSQRRFLSYYPFAVYGNMEHAFNVHSSCDGWMGNFSLADWSWTKQLIIRSSRRLSLKPTLHRPFSWPGGGFRGGKSAQQIDSTLISVYCRNNWTPTRCLLLIMHIECKSLRPKRFKFFARLSGRVMYDSRLQTHIALWFRAEVAKLNHIQLAARLFRHSSVSTEDLKRTMNGLWYVSIKALSTNTIA